MLTWPTLRCRADIDHVAVGTAFLLVGSAFLLLAIANPPDAWMLRMAAGLVVRIAFPLLGVAARGRIPAGQMGTGWVPVLLGAVAAPMSGIAALWGRMDAARGRIPAVCGRALALWYRGLGGAVGGRALVPS
jgi:hypothetical protein